MKHWNETAQLLDRAAALAAAGRRAALATVVGIRGSAYRRPGARLLIEDDGATLGGVSGGCLEGDVREVALDVLRTGIPHLLHYETGDDDSVVWGLGLGCSGSVDVFVQPADSPRSADGLRAARALLSGDEPFAICTVIEGAVDLGRVAAFGAGGDVSASADRALERLSIAALGRGESGLQQAGPRRVFVEVLSPPPSLFICGAGDDARPLAALAASAGFGVTVLDHRPAYVTAERFPAARRLECRRPEAGVGDLRVGPDAAVVSMTHSFAHDRDWLRAFLATDARFIGLLGPRDRRDEILRQLGADDEARVFGPVGLDLAADGPEQIAVSIVAELLAVRAGREPGHLRDREAAIHAC